MPEAIWLGIAAVLLGGLMEGSFALPMKYARHWLCENIWCVYSLIGLIVIPWLATSLAAENRV